MSTPPSLLSQQSTDGSDLSESAAAPIQPIGFERQGNPVNKLNSELLGSDRNSTMSPGLSDGPPITRHLFDNEQNVSITLMDGISINTSDIWDPIQQRSNPFAKLDMSSPASTKQTESSLSQKNVIEGLEALLQSSSERRKLIGAGDGPVSLRISNSSPITFTTNSLSGAKYKKANGKISDSKDISSIRTEKHCLDLSPDLISPFHNPLNSIDNHTILNRNEIRQTEALSLLNGKPGSSKTLEQNLSSTPIDLRQKLEAIGFGPIELEYGGVAKSIEGTLSRKLGDLQSLSDRKSIVNQIDSNYFDILADNMDITSSIKNMKSKFATQTNNGVEKFTENPNSAQSSLTQMSSKIDALESFGRMQDMEEEFISILSPSITPDSVRSSVGPPPGLALTSLNNLNSSTPYSKLVERSTRSPAASTPTLGDGRGLGLNGPMSGLDILDPIAKIVNGDSQVRSSPSPPEGINRSGQNRPAQQNGTEQHSNKRGFLLLPYSGCQVNPSEPAQIRRKLVNEESPNIVYMNFPFLKGDTITLEVTHVDVPKDELEFGLVFGVTSCSPEKIAEPTINNLHGRKHCRPNYPCNGYSARIKVYKTSETGVRVRFERADDGQITFRIRNGKTNFITFYDVDDFSFKGADNLTPFLQLTGCVSGLRILGKDEESLGIEQQLNSSINSSLNSGPEGVQLPKTLRIQAGSLDEICVYSNLSVIRNQVHWQDFSKNGVLLIERPFKWYDTISFVVRANRQFQGCAVRFGLMSTAQVQMFKKFGQFKAENVAPVAIFPKADQMFTILRKKHEVCLMFKTAHKRVLDVNVTHSVFPVFIFAGIVTAFDLVAFDNERTREQ